jgi:hypothetical protein
VPQVVYVLREVHNRVAIGVLALLQDGEMLRYLAQTTPARPHKGQPDPTPGGDPDPDLARLLPRYVPAAVLVLPGGCSARRIGMSWFVCRVVPDACCSRRWIDCHAVL